MRIGNRQFDVGAYRWRRRFDTALSEQLKHRGTAHVRTREGIYWHIYDSYGAAEDVEPSRFLMNYGAPA
jgi:hypothetical protein